MRKIFTLFTGLMIAGFAAKAQTPTFDVQHYTFAIGLNDADNNIKGQATVSVKFLKDVSSFELSLVKKNDKGKGMLISGITEGGKRVSFAQDSDTFKINTTAKAGSVHNYTIKYEGVPADGLIISTNRFGHRTFFGDNWPNRAHNWLPCADYPGDKATLDFVVTAPDHYSVISNGLKIEEEQLPNHLKLTHYKETAQLPTKVMVIGVAEFAIDNAGTVDNIPVYTYVFPENKEPGFKNYKVATEILPYYIKNVGPYAYKKLANVQSKTIFGGMENAGSIFYFEESPVSAGIEELMAHEIAHQWFGDAASEKNFGHVWLSEGFATYMTNLYLENKYGADTLKKRELADRKTVFNFEKRRHTPVVDSAVKNNFMQLLNANSYQKGGWVLHMLRRKLGDDVFWKGIKAYYAKYNGGNAYTSGLEKIMEEAGKQDLKQFFTQWIYTAGHPDLKILWKYDASKGEVELTVTQTQDYLYEVPLEIALDKDQHTINLKDRITVTRFKASAKPAEVKADPNVNLLATFDVRAGE